MSFVPQDIDLNDFDYNLPKEKIALYPAINRSSSKLLIANKNDKIETDSFDNIDNYLPDNSLIIFNTTKVISARLLLQKPTGGNVELLCINPIFPSTDPQISMNAKQSCKWLCYVGGRNINKDLILNLPDDSFQFQARIIERFENQAIVEFHYNKDLSFSEILEKIGLIPLPPYISREAEDIDKERYQTVYSNAEGSVAAPTAGLHFTDEIIDRLSMNNHSFAEVVLHVGPGTFKPIESKVSEHKMHQELFFVSIDTISKICKCLSENFAIISTGTTSLRTLESLYWLSLKSFYEKIDIFDSNLVLQQYDSYELQSKYSNFSRKDAFNHLFDMLSKHNRNVISGETKLFIMPGYQIKTADALITNFHLPKSTLLLLVSSFIGDKRRKEIYDYALLNDFRFLSYGDSSLLIR